MYAAVGGLRRLLHELTVIGVAAARYAALEARETQLYDNTQALQAKLTKAKAAKAAACATMAQLQARLVALRKANPGEQSAEAKRLAIDTTAAEIAHDDARDSVNDCRTEIQHNYEQWKRAQSQMDVINGARTPLDVAACLRVPLSCGPDSLTSLASASCNHTVAATVCSPSSRYGLLCLFRSPALLRSSDSPLLALALPLL